ncbi:MAG: PGF-CTERM sorting domain-containing protein, partial [Candidatus Thermoplasmatota archaeon]|nr:PGF-CTERM sorting domain-containing protein [Candidatus Thermoplasmatota archaeon]
NVKVTCRMEPVLDEDIILTVGEMIDMRFMLNLNGQWTNGQESCSGDCENLNVSLMKGGREVAVREYDSLSDGENAVQWQLPVTEDLAYWNGSQESFTVEFRMVINSQAGGFPFSSDDDAIFGLFYTHPNHAPEYNASVTFPIMNESAVEELTGGSGGGQESGGPLPGFGAIVGISGLAAAALLRNEDEE